MIGRLLLAVFVLAAWLAPSAGAMPAYVYGDSLASCCYNQSLMQQRWPDQLGASNEGRGGTTASGWASSPQWYAGHAGSEAAVILGTNSVQLGVSGAAWEASYRAFLIALIDQFDLIQAIQMPTLTLSSWTPAEAFISRALQLDYAARLLGLCAELGNVSCSVSFQSIDASLKWDEVHFTEQGHNAAAVVYLPEPSTRALWLPSLIYLAILRPPRETAL